MQRQQRGVLERALAEAKAKLDEASATNVRLQRESEYIIANVNRWVAEQKYSLLLVLHPTPLPIAHCPPAHAPKPMYKHGLWHTLVATLQLCKCNPSN